MSKFFDYIFVQLYEFYNSFENEPSLFAAKGIVALMQLFLLINALNAASYYTNIPSSLKGMATMGPLLILLYMRLHIRYSNKAFFSSIVAKHRNKDKNMRLVTGAGSLLLLVASFIMATIFGRFTH